MLPIAIPATRITAHETSSQISLGRRGRVGPGSGAVPAGAPEPGIIRFGAAAPVGGDAGVGVCGWMWGWDAISAYSNVVCLGRGRTGGWGSESVLRASAGLGAVVGRLVRSSVSGSGCCGSVVDAAAELAAGSGGVSVGVPDGSAEPDTVDTSDVFPGVRKGVAGDKGDGVGDGVLEAWASISSCWRRCWSGLMRPSASLESSRCNSSSQVIARDPLNRCNAYGALYCFPVCLGSVEVKSKYVVVRSRNGAARVC